MIKVGIVEDNQTVREGFATLLNRTPGFQCVCACGTVAEALKKIPKAKPDVVLMDIQLPDSTGVECTAKIKEQMPAVHIVIVTVYEDSERIFQALRAGACGYLLKRTAPDKIVEAIREAREGGMPLTPRMASKVAAYFQGQDKSHSEVGTLSPRELQTLELLAEGFLYKEIAEKMGISYLTVTQFTKHIYEKLHVHSRTEAVVKFLKR